MARRQSTLRIYIVGFLCEDEIGAPREAADGMLHSIGYIYLRVTQG
jgi:hypothetical protein